MDTRTTEMLIAELAEADAAFEELAIAARRLLYALAHRLHPESFWALAELVGWRYGDGSATVETAHAAGEED